MADVSMTTAAEPDGAPRIAVLDILRGLAILGILFMNINDMGQSMTASFDDIRHLGWSTADQVAWWLREVLANGTARCLLEMLFGAGMVILTTRAARTASFRRVMASYYWRNIVLFLFGLVHVFVLLWPGEILHTYGLAALVAFLFHRLRPRWLLTIGLILAMLQLTAGSYFGYYRGIQHRAEVASIEAKRQGGATLSAAERKTLVKDAESKQKRARADAEEKASIAREDKDRGGTFMTWTAAQWRSFIEIESYFLEPLFVWEAASVMLIGAALFKLGILQGNRSRRFYLGLTLACYAAGITMRIIAAYGDTRFDGLPHIGGPMYELAREVMTLGHVGLVNWLVTSAAGAALLRPFVAAGRTALTIYIAQTMICLWVIYPPFMLGLYGRMTWAPLMVTAFVVNAVLLWLANMWVRYFDIAPVEWAWRSILERRLLPWRAPRRAPPFAGEPVAA